MMSSMYESEKEDIFVFITLVSSFECYYELKYEKASASQIIFSISLHYFNLGASSKSIIIILLIVVRVSF